MSVTLVCPTCHARWKIIVTHVRGDHPELCPVCISKNGKKES